MGTDEAANSHTPSRRDLIKWGLGGVGALALGPTLLSACGSSASSAKSGTKAAPTTSPVLDPDMLALARKEGMLNLVAVPTGEGSAYLDLVNTFKKLTGLQIVITNPGGSSAMEISEVIEKKGQPTQPDVVDLGVSYAIDAASRGLLSPYRASGLADVPTDWTDVRANWSCAYFALTSIVTNASEIENPPKSFADLLELPDDGGFGLNGDPRSDSSGLGSAAAFSSLWAAALANGGSYDDITPGIDFFRQLRSKGIFDPSNITIPELMAGKGESDNKPKVGLITNTEVPLMIAFAKGKSGSGDKFEAHIPLDGLFPTSYAQAAVADSPHPNAAKLWLDYLLSDAGALAYMRGGAVSTRFSAMNARGRIPADVLSGLPDAKLIAELRPPTKRQTDVAQKIVNEQWGSKVLDA